MSDLFEKRFVVVTGKGGVGRTTVSILIGLCAAERQKKTLVCLCKSPMGYGPLLGDVVLSDKIQQITSTLSVVNLDPVSARQEYGKMVFRSRAMHQFLFGSKVFNDFLDAVPGLAEWAMFGKATYHALNAPDGIPEFDLVVFDAPATGHSLDVLALPELIVETVKKGRMAEEAASRVALLKDATRCEIVPVTLPEELPVSEVIEMIASLKAKHVPVHRLVVNRVTGTHCSDALEKLVANQSQHEKMPQWLYPSWVRLSQWQQLQDSLQRLGKTTSLPLIQLPQLEAGQGQIPDLKQLVAIFRDEIEKLTL